MSCFHCEKTVLMGRTHTHHRGVAGGRWKKRAQKVARAFYPNLQRVEITLNEESKTVKLCAKCIKRIKKDTREGVTPFLKLANIDKIMPKVEAA